MLHVVARMLRAFPLEGLLPCCAGGAGAAAAMPAGTACWPECVADVPIERPVWFRSGFLHLQKTAWPGDDG